ncbi:MAG TPA: efflux RND transporter periplasmic adaptor subunit [Candidatus Polarisedimenticolaceae bacterium]|nr:efflux RND transporter periplasmic adaptor subunit [Candidatus Polarisedimenticolaceae bacterium]
MNRRFPLLAGLLLPVLIAAACKEKAPPPPPPPDVKVAPVLQRDVPIYIEAIGETRGSSEIEVRARVEGFVESVDFKEGSVVAKGQLLYRIDSRPFQASVAQAKGVVAEAEAGLARAQQDVTRYEPLVAKNAISRQDYETSVQVKRAAEAALDAAKASLDRAQIDLSYTRVVSPAAGVVGKTEVYPGTLVGRGQSTLLTRISQIENIHARVNIPERDYLEYARRAEQRKEPEPERAFELVLADGTVHPEKGKLVFVDRAVDSATGTILVEVAFPNPGGLIRPGQYGRVRVAIDERKGAILVPQRAVNELQGTYSVAVVKPDDTVDLRMVTAGPRVGNLWVIEQGLKPDEKIIVEGGLKVRPGMKVTPVPVTIAEK